MQFRHQLFLDQINQLKIGWPANQETFIKKETEMSRLTVRFLWNVVWLLILTNSVFTSKLTMSWFLTWWCVIISWMLILPNTVIDTSLLMMCHNFILGRKNQRLGVCIGACPAVQMNFTHRCARLWNQCARHEIRQKFYTAGFSGTDCAP